MQQSMKRLIDSTQLRELKSDYIAVKLFASNESCARSRTPQPHYLPHVLKELLL